MPCNERRRRIALFRQLSTRKRCDWCAARACNFRFALVRGLPLHIQRVGRLGLPQTRRVLSFSYLLHRGGCFWLFFSHCSGFSISLMMSAMVVKKTSACGSAAHCKAMPMFSCVFGAVMCVVLISSFWHCDVAYGTCHTAQLNLLAVHAPTACRCGDALASGW